MNAERLPPLLVSAVNGGGVFLIDGGRVEDWSKVDTTGLACLADGSVLLARQAEGVAEVRRWRNGVVHRVGLAQRSLDLHDLAATDRGVLVVATQLNTVYEFDFDFRELRHWALPGEQDSYHLNSAGIYEGRVIASRFGRFNAHRAYKGLTKGAGEVINLDDGEVIVRGLSQPHSLLVDGRSLWLCNSEEGEVHCYRDGDRLARFRFEGYTRGLAHAGRFLFVGLSRSRNAPEAGIASACVVVVDRSSGHELRRIELPVDEIYGIHVVDDRAIPELRRSALADAVAEFDTQVDNRNRAVDAVAARVAVLEAQARELDGARNGAKPAGSVATGILHESDAQARALGDAQRWADLLDGELRAMRADDIVLRGTMESLHVAAREMQAENVQLRARLTGLVRDARELLDAQGSTIELLRTRLEQIESSRSWRWTRPFRDDGAVMPEMVGVDDTSLLDRFDSSAAASCQALDTPATEVPSVHVAEPRVPLNRAVLGVPGLCFPKCAEPLVSILVTAWGGFDMTRTCLESVQAAAPSIPYEVILVEDASDDPEMDRFGGVPGLRYLRNPDNLGFLRSVNAALPLVRGRFLHLLNNDTRVFPGWLEPLIDTFALFHNCGIAGSRLIGADGKLQEAGGVVWADGSGWNIGRGDHPDDPAHRALREVDYVSGASLLVPTDLIREVGGLDERYAPAYYEDTDLAFRLRERGLKTFYQPRSRVMHAEGGSHGTDPQCGGKVHQEHGRKAFVDRWGAILQRDQCPPGKMAWLAARRAQLLPTVLVVDRHAPMTDCDAGSRAIWHLIRALQVEGCDVRFWSQRAGGDAGGRVLLEAHGVDYLDADVAGESLRTWISRHGAFFDHVVLSRPEVAFGVIEYARAVTAARIAYYGHDIHYLRLRRQHAVQGGGDDSARTLWAWREAEERIWCEADLILYPSDEETGIVSEVLAAANARGRAATMPLFGLPPATSPAPSPQGRSDLLFVGGFAHAPNRDGVEWFIRRIWQRLRERAPDLRFLVVGDGADDALLALGGDGVEFMGRVTEAVLADLYRSARVVVAPLRFGAGVKGKVVEAMHAGVPCVTTPTGAQGLKDADALLVAGDEDGFIAHANTLLSDDDLWRERSERGRAFVDAHYSVQALGSQVRRLFDVTPYPDVGTRLAMIEDRIANIRHAGVLAHPGEAEQEP